MQKPDIKNSASAKEMDKVEKQLDAFNENVESLTLDNMNRAKKFEIEPQTKLSQQELFNTTDIFLKPFKTISSGDKFNEKYRDSWNFDKQTVYFIAENKEIIGEHIEMWTKPYAGVPAEFWKVPVNKPIHGPRYLAEQIKRCTYHTLVMKKGTSAGVDEFGEYQGVMAASNTVNRLDATPATKQRSIFMGSNNFS
jgi:hypothetical protein